MPVIWWFCVLGVWFWVGFVCGAVGLIWFWMWGCDCLCVVCRLLVLLCFVGSALVCVCYVCFVCCVLAAIVVDLLVDGGCCWFGIWVFYLCADCFADCLILAILVVFVLCLLPAFAGGLGVGLTCRLFCISIYCCLVAVLFLSSVRRLC